MELTLGEAPVSTFTQAVKRTFDIAMARLPKELHGHLERATALVLHHHVFPTDDGRHAQVLSSDGERWYPVNGHCTCMDATKAPQGLCKHRLAFGLYRRASELLAQHGGAAAPAPVALPEAPASVTVRVLIDGRECQMTLRDVDEERLLTRVQAVLQRYPEAHSAPAIVAPTGEAATDTPVCKYHGAMKASTKAPGTFFCTKKLADGSYCPSRHPQR